ncbi:unnamed protein product [Kluyveromyces dobzhanskii CBS 2104]|uniref:WGS project CCBQ000000000 data, contig 00058 n=1 Tax=Kluyveromyces dobzhanskii CBS 2104 TaxID=1427455 RepID=A0A0A8LD69_9SACH|nr:unnamed protein product [Kluyveromyces dobzhanskii CBS 2104]
MIPTSLITILALALVQVNGHTHHGSGSIAHGHSHANAYNGNAHQMNNGIVFQCLQTAFPLSAKYNALLATIYLSALPCLLVMMIPGFKRGGTKMVRLMVPFALGGILGDVFLHVLPELYNAGGNPVDIGYGILYGFLSFMAIDKMLRIINLGNANSHSHSHSHSHLTDDEELREMKRTDEVSGDGNTKGTGLDQKTKNNSLMVSTYLNMVSEFIHKATDGIAVASSFYTSQYVGIMSFIAIVFHEVPHELGDFAVKLSSGLTFKQAIESELFTCFGTFTGAVIGCVLNEMGKHDKEFNNEAWTNKIMVMTCGGFIYSSTVGVVPELLQIRTKSKQQEITTTIIQIGCTLAGFYMMSIIE